MRVPGDDWVLIGGDGIPANAEVVYSVMIVPNARQAGDDCFETLLLQAIWDRCLIALSRIGAFDVWAWWWG